MSYTLAGNEHCVVWDMPGAGTKLHPADTYFDDKLLCGFDGLLLMSANTFLEADLEVIKRAQHYNIPVALVRTKSDTHLEALMHTDDLDEKAAEG